MKFYDFVSSGASLSAKENKCKIKLLIINMSAVLFFISTRNPVLI